MPCTNEKPCLAPILRWVHSKKCREETARLRPPKETGRARLEGTLRVRLEGSADAPSEHGGGEGRCPECSGEGVVFRTIESQPQCAACGGTGQAPGKERGT